MPVFADYLGIFEGEAKTKANVVMRPPRRRTPAIGRCRVARTSVQLDVRGGATAFICGSRWPSHTTDKGGRHDCAAQLPLEGADKGGISQLLFVGVFRRLVAPYHSCLVDTLASP